MNGGDIGVQHTALIIQPCSQVSDNVVIALHFSNARMQAAPYNTAADS